MIHLKTRPVYVSSYFMKIFLQYLKYEQGKMIGRIRKGKGKNKTVCQNQFFYNTFQCILKSNIDKNFTIHIYVRFGDLSHDITGCLIWTTRSPH